MYKVWEKQTFSSKTIRLQVVMLRRNEPVINVSTLQEYHEQSLQKHHVRVLTNNVIKISGDTSAGKAVFFLTDILCKRCFIR